MHEPFTAGVGGFVGLEDPQLAPDATRASTWPGDGVRFATGRAAFRAVLETLRPSVVYVPSYICRVILEPLRSTGTAWRRYATAPDLSHDHAPRPDAGELLLVVDHFGLQGDAMHALADRYAERLVVDATQALFAAATPDAWRFTSARKFLGVPDGATVEGPRAIAAAPERRPDGSVEHLEQRAAGRTESARAAFLAHERTLDDRRLAPSQTAERLMARIDVDRVIAARRENFAVLDERLAAVNGLAPELPAIGAPHAYPLLADRAVELEALHRQRLFVPCFWPEMPDGVDRDDASGHEPTATALAERLLPLPVDQRYDAETMHRVADAVLALLRR